MNRKLPIADNRQLYDYYDKLPTLKVRSTRFESGLSRFQEITSAHTHLQNNLCLR